jgi:hypothetical protein
MDGPVVLPAIEATGISLTAVKAGNMGRALDAKCEHARRIRLWLTVS